jgi:hypothetical protein
MRRARLHRLALVLTATFQLLLPTFASVADARAEAVSERGAPAHVESHSTSQCVPVHAADCAICRVIAGSASVAHAPVVPVAVTRVIESTLPRHEMRATGTPARGDPSQRAPPAA